MHPALQAAEEAASAAGEHAAEAASHGGHDLATMLHHHWAWLVQALVPGTKPVAHGHHAGPLVGMEWLLISWACVFVLAYIAYRGTRRMSLYPRGMQNVFEIIYEWLDEFVCGIMGPIGKDYIALVGTAFIYVFTLNAVGLIPGVLSPTANLHCTAGLAISIVLYVHYQAIARTGFRAWFRHLMDIDNVPLGMTPLMFIIHSIGEFLAKPLSLACRLFGNIYGEDQVIINLTALGITIFQSTYIPLPLQLPLMIFGIFTSAVQALVFSMLTTIYLATFLSHADHGDDHGDHGHAHGHGHDHHAPAGATAHAGGHH